MKKEIRKCSEGQTYFCDFDRRFKCDKFCKNHKDYKSEELDEAKVILTTIIILIGLYLYIK